MAKRGVRRKRKRVITVATKRHLFAVARELRQEINVLKDRIAPYKSELERLSTNQVVLEKLVVRLLKEREA